MGELQSNASNFSFQIYVYFIFGIDILWNLLLVAIFHSQADVVLKQRYSSLNIGGMHIFQFEFYISAVIHCYECSLFMNAEFTPYKLYWGTLCTDLSVA